MTVQNFDDETLMAYADGELAPEDAARVKRAMANEPGVAARVELFRRTRQAVADDARAHPPAVPDALAARVRELGVGAEDARVHPMPPRPVARPGAGQRWRLPLAASLALAIGLGAGFYGGQRREATPGLRVATLDHPPLVEALESVPSGDRATLAGGEVAFVTSFRNLDGALCREFEYVREGDAPVVSVACQDDGGWDVRFAVAAGRDDAGYAPASSLESLDAFVASTAAGPPLSPEAEAAALAGVR